jgi:alginate O-acetyltransferase complex protein AlgI
MNYSAPGYLFLFLPVLLIVYQLTPKKFRWIVLLTADYIFFWLWSKTLIVYLLVSTLITYLFGRKLASMKKAPEGMDRKVFRKKKKHVEVLAVLIELGILVVLKYTNFIGENLSALAGSEYTALKIGVPVGISYYTLQSVSYLSDVASRKIKDASSLKKLALYMSFFPTIVEGPITRFSDMSEQLVSGSPVTAQSLQEGFERILWGMFKKVIIADHLVHAVDSIFSDYTTYGALAFLGAVLCTLQLYADFSGTIDIAIGTGKLFHIQIAENFRQPFFAKNAGDFWRRWHITLGTFFRDYIFYPVSLSKPMMNLSKWFKKRKLKWCAKYTGPLIALLLVWLANGFWHGPYWTYVGYGLYYFVLMFVEMQLEKPFEAWCAKHHLDGKPLRIFRFIKLFFIVIIGEMFFRASTFADGWTMFTSWFTNFDAGAAWHELQYLGMDDWDWLVTALAWIPVIIVSVLKERHVPIRQKFERMPALCRWGVLYVFLFAVIFFGAYGPGYDAVAMMYAGF